jgi:hypothetical protein
MQNKAKPRITALPAVEVINRVLLAALFCGNHGSCIPVSYRLFTAPHPQKIVTGKRTVKQRALLYMNKQKKALSGTSDGIKMISGELSQGYDSSKKIPGTSSYGYDSPNLIAGTTSYGYGDSKLVSGKLS